MSETQKGAELVPQRTMQRNFSLLPQSLGDAREMATIISKSGFAPKAYEGNPDAIMVAIQMGADLGLKPMQSLQNIAVINGRPSIYGDAALALVMPVLERFAESFEGTEGSDDYTAVCIAKRKGWPDETRRTFSIGDAKKANLWGKSGPWQTYPKRMLQWRARGFALRDVGADLLLGLILVEEAQDISPPIEGHVVSSEIVPEPPNAITLFDQLPEGIRDNIEKAFTTLNFAPGARLAKLTEYFGGDGIVPDEQAQALLDWLRDEFAKRRTGQPRKKGSNAKDTKAADPAGGGTDGTGTVGTASDPAPSAPASGGTRPDPGERVAEPAAPVAAPVEDALF